MIEVISILLEVVGAFFLISAAVGVVRFADPLQRMHATTKAGTVGAGFILLGVMIEMGGWDVVLIGGATLLFLLFTVPVGGHLLGRATYVSGARLDGLRGDDALEGVLERSPITFDEVLDRAEIPGGSIPPRPGRPPP